MEPERARQELNGLWVNELGSTVRLNFEKEGRLTGTYTTTVGHATHDAELVGTFASDPTSTSLVVAFAVAWTQVKEGKKPSAASWSGRIDLAHGEKPTLNATWLLTRMKGSPWCCTRIGKSTFIKQEQ